MEITPLQKRKLEKLEKLLNGGDLGMVNEILDLEDTFESQVSKVNEIAEEIKSIIPELKDGQDYVLTDKDREDIAKLTASKIKIPIVEKVIEKIEVQTKVEQPIVTEIHNITNEIKEVAVTDEPDVIVEKVNKSSKKISADRVDMSDVLNKLSETDRIAKANALPITTTFVNGKRAKNINFPSSTVTYEGDTATIISPAGGSSWTVVSSNTTAENDEQYNVIASATFTDPSPQAGKGYWVVVRNGTATIGGVGYSTAGTLIYRIFHSGAWATYYQSPFNDATSSIQTQLNAKQDTITGGATTITTSNLTASRALISNGSGKVAVSATTDTELGYVSGVTSAIQTQLDAKAPVSTTMLDPLYEQTFFQDFAFDTSQGSTANYQTGTQGGAGQAGALLTSTYTNAVGVYRLTSGTTTGVGLALQTNPQQIGTFRPGTYAAKFVTRTNLSAASNSTERYITRQGLITAAYNADPTSGIYFRYTDNVNSGNWQCVCRNGGSETVINTSVAPAITTNWDKLEWRINAAGTSVEFFINNVSQGTTTTNIPTTTYLLLWLVLHKVSGSSSQLMDIDLYYFKVTRTI